VQIDEMEGVFYFEIFSRFGNRAGEILKNRRNRLRIAIVMPKLTMTMKKLSFKEDGDLADSVCFNNANTPRPTFLNFPVSVYNCAAIVASGVSPELARCFITMESGLDNSLVFPRINFFLEDLETLHLPKMGDRRLSSPV
jgi:hypothetical protein